MTDIDECTTSEPCQQICRNIVGSYVCSCRDNYVVVPENPSRCESMYSFGLFQVPKHNSAGQSLMKTVMFVTASK